MYEERKQQQKQKNDFCEEENYYDDSSWRIPLFPIVYIPIMILISIWKTDV